MEARPRLEYMKIFDMTSRPPAVNDFKFRDNIRDAADSAERNFPEGFGRFGPKDFARFLDHSKASLLETKNELRVGLRRRYFSEQDVREARRLVDRDAFGNAISGAANQLENHGPTNREPTNRGTQEPTNCYNWGFSGF